jgi:hypothetical protein
MNKLLRAILIGAILVVCMGCNVSTRISPTTRPTAKTIVPPTLQQESLIRTPQAIDNIDQIISPEEIKEFLIGKIGASAFGGKIFCAYQVMGTDQENQTIKIYLWVLVQEYYVSKQSLQEGTATSEPVVLFVTIQNGKYQIFDYKDAGESYQYLTVNFPPNILPLIRLPADEYNQRVASLLSETRKEAEAYFGIH